LKDYAFLLQLVAKKQYGLRLQQMAFEEQLKVNLKACSHQLVLGLIKNEHLPEL